MGWGWGGGVTMTDKQTKIPVSFLLAAIVSPCSTLTALGATQSNPPSGSSFLEGQGGQPLSCYASDPHIIAPGAWAERRGGGEGLGLGYAVPFYPAPLVNSDPGVP